MWFPAQVISGFFTDDPYRERDDVYQALRSAAWFVAERVIERVSPCVAIGRGVSHRAHAERGAGEQCREGCDPVPSIHALRRSLEVAHRSQPAGLGALEGTATI